jgi:hypothetical protein
MTVLIFLVFIFIEAPSSFFLLVLLINKFMTRQCEIDRGFWFLGLFI